MKVLIIEPSKELANIIAARISKEGASAYIAHTTQAGISVADKNKPDIVILELLISGHNGLEFLHEFKSYHDWFDVPIVIYSDLSAEELDSAVGWEEDMNIVNHFYKPTTSLKELNDYALSIVNES